MAWMEGIFCRYSIEFDIKLSQIIKFQVCHRKKASGKKKWLSLKVVWNLHKYYAKFIVIIPNPPDHKFQKLFIKDAVQNKRDN